LYFVQTVTKKVVVSLCVFRALQFNGGEGI
jgi:hypothetical protein